jgi:hypothetical protein
VNLHDRHAGNEEQGAIEVHETDRSRMFCQDAKIDRFGHGQRDKGGPEQSRDAS